MRIALLVKLAIKTTDNSDMYNRAFPVGNALFLFAGGMMSLLCLPCGKFPCQTVDDFIGDREKCLCMKDAGCYKTARSPAIRKPCRFVLCVG